MWETYLTRDDYYDQVSVVSFKDGRERKIYYSEKTPITYLEPFEYLFLEYCQHIIRQ